MSSSAQNYFKDPDYFKAITNYDKCLFTYFQEIKDDHKQFDNVVRQKNFKYCNKEYQILKDKIAGGALDYENFAK